MITKNLLIQSATPDVLARFDLGDMLESLFGKGHPVTKLSARLRTLHDDPETGPIAPRDFICERCTEITTKETAESVEMICCAPCAEGRCLARAYRTDRPEARTLQRLLDLRGALEREMKKYQEIMEQYKDVMFTIQMDCAHSKKGVLQRGDECPLCGGRAWPSLGAK